MTHHSRVWSHSPSAHATTSSSLATTVSASDLLVLRWYTRESPLSPDAARLREVARAARRSRPLLGQVSDFVGVDALGVCAPLPLGALLDAPPRISLESRRSRSTPPNVIPRATPHLQRPAARRRPDLHPRVHVPQLHAIQPRTISPDGHAPRSRADGRRRPSPRDGIIGIAGLDGHGPPLHSVQQSSGSTGNGPENRAAPGPAPQPYLPSAAEPVPALEAPPAARLWYEYDSARPPRRVAVFRRSSRRRVDPPVDCRGLLDPLFQKFRRTTLGPGPCRRPTRHAMLH